MANKMLIDAAHPEETRVVVLRGNRVEEFDFESASKKPLRGNIYLAKVTRVEPSLQAAFIEYGGNRHGFLAFSEIHPDYYQIPVADRQALLEEEARAHREEDDEPRSGGGGGGNGRRSRRHGRKGGGGASPKRADPGDETVSAASEVESSADTEAQAIDESTFDAGAPGEPIATPVTDDREAELPFDEGGPDEFAAPTPEILTVEAPAEEDPLEFLDLPSETASASLEGEDALVDEAAEDEVGSDVEAAPPVDRHDDAQHADEIGPGEEEEETVELLGGDALEDVPVRGHRSRRNYKIQEVIKRRQILLVQVVKEERGNKGAALTTYLSLAGRYSVLMPNTARGGGISRKITDSDDRKRLKAIAQDLEVPEGMGVILRTAGAARSDSEVRRDFEYLLRMWETVRELTLRSSAPMQVYEEGSLIKRAIRDLYSKEIDEICVAGETGFREAKDYMRLLMPTHAKNVQFYRDTQPIFAKSGVEAQLDAMFSNHVTLKSGGYIVINQTEALVAIDVNSGRSTREHNIEDTAVRTNLEAADEVARQLRLRDLAGLIVVDFIDMEEGRNNRAVERRIKDALKNDRARIQIGRISHFGLLEMSRQRIRTGVLEGSTVICPHCAGSGTVRSTSSIALHVLRVLEDTLIRGATHNLLVRTRMEVALYMLNQKRAHLSDLEQRFGVSLTVMGDATLTGTIYHAIERGDLATPVVPIARQAAGQELVDDVADEEIVDVEDEIDEEAAAEAGAERSSADRDQRRPDDVEDGEGSGDRKRKRRRRRRGRDRDPRDPAASAASDDATDGDETLDGDERSAERPEAETIDAGSDPDLTVVASIETGTDLVAEENASSEPIVTETAPVEMEAPRRRRSRRTGSRATVAEGSPPIAEPAPVASSEEVAPAPRRSRRAKTRVVEEPTLGFDAPSADRDVGADTAQNHPSGSDAAPIAESTDGNGKTLATPGPAKAEPVVAPVVDPIPDSKAEPAEADATPASATPAPVVEDDASSKPKRSGWWQRAKATLTGE